MSKNRLFWENVTPWNGQKMAKICQTRVFPSNDYLFPLSNHISQLNTKNYENLMRRFWEIGKNKPFWKGEFQIFFPTPPPGGQILTYVTPWKWVYNGHRITENVENAIKINLTDHLLINLSWRNQISCIKW